MPSPTISQGLPRSGVEVKQGGRIVCATEGSNLRAGRWVGGKMWPPRTGAASIINGLCRLSNRFGVGQLVKIGDGAFSMGGGLDNGVGVVLQHLDPACDIAGVIGAGLDTKPQIGGKKGGAQFRD